MFLSIKILLDPSDVIGLLIGPYDRLFFQELLKIVENRAVSRHGY